MWVRHWRKTTLLPLHERPVIVAVWEFPDSSFEVDAGYINCEGKVSDIGGTWSVGGSALLAEATDGKCYVIGRDDLVLFYPGWVPE